MPDSQTPAATNNNMHSSSSLQQQSKQIATHTSIDLLNTTV